MRTLIRLLVASLLLATGLSVFASPAGADPGCEVRDPVTGLCKIQVPPPPPPPPPTDDEVPSDGGGGGEPAGCKLSSGTTVPCENGGGYWSNGRQCYVKLADPQPPASDPVWEGHRPGDGAIYACFWLNEEYTFTYFWAGNPPAGPSPEQLAQDALASLTFKAIDVGIVPEPGPDSIGIVGLPTWMWAESPSAATVGPLTASASAGGTTVTVTVTLERIEWEMGDGTTVTCSGANVAGTEYQDHFGVRESPTCGHRYETTSWGQPGHRFRVTASSYWRADWTGGGQSGTIRIDPLQRVVNLRVGEAQTLVQ